MLDAWALRNSRWRKRAAHALYEGANLRAAACIHAVCDQEADSIGAHGIDATVCIIPNGVKLPEDRRRVTPVWHVKIPHSSKILLYLGRLHPKKGLVNLLKAWSAISRQPPAADWHLVIAGWDDGGHEADLKRLAKESGISQRVSFVGPLYGAEKDSALRNAHGSILPSYSEGLPVAVLEAWAYGLPVVMTPQCNLVEGFEVGAALRVEPTTESVTEGLSGLLQLSEPELHLMGVRGRQLVQERFTWERVAREMTAVYKWLLGGGVPPTCVRRT